MRRHKHEKTIVVVVEVVPAAAGGIRVLKVYLYLAWKPFFLISSCMITTNHMGLCSASPGGGPTRLLDFVERQGKKSVKNEARLFRRCPDLLRQWPG